MLRMGKNPNEERIPTQPQPSVENYSQRTYAPQPVEQKAPEAPSAQRALSESETIAREIKDGTLSGFVGSGTAITGEATFKSLLRIDGKFSGRIASPSGTLIVGAGGVVDANIEVSIATILGTVNGDIIATQRIELGRAGKLNGNIQTPSLMIEQGAVFEGSCKMIQQKAAAEKPARVERKDNVMDTPKPEAKIDAPKVASIAAVS